MPVRRLPRRVAAHESRSGAPSDLKVSLVAEILELQSNWKILGAHGRDDRLQLIATFGCHSYFAALNLSGDLEFSFPDETGDLFGHGLLQTLFDLDELPRVTQWRNVRVASLHIFQADIALDQLAHHDCSQRLDFELVLGGEPDFILFQNNFRLAS